MSPEIVPKPSEHVHPEGMSPTSAPDFPPSVRHVPTAPGRRSAPPNDPLLRGPLMPSPDPALWCCQLSDSRPSAWPGPQWVPLILWTR